jgi:hypothetical protein
MPWAQLTVLELKNTRAAARLLCQIGVRARYRALRLTALQWLRLPWLFWPLAASAAITIILDGVAVAWNATLGDSAAGSGIESELDLLHAGLVILPFALLLAYWVHRRHVRWMYTDLRDDANFALRRARWELRRR